MSRFLSARHAALEPYVPGEQPVARDFIKLNTNENPFPPTDAVLRAAFEAGADMNYYNDPDCTLLRKAAARFYGVSPENLLATNGSDEALYFAMLAFGDETRPFAFADLTYSFYPVFASVCHIPAHIIPLQEDFTLNFRDYLGLGENILIVNPNAPTGMALPLLQIERIAETNPDRVVIVDEAYVDFGGESCVPLLAKHKNLLVIQTFSKSRSLAGGRLGFAIGSEELLNDLYTVRNSINPYSVNRMTQAAGVAAFSEPEVYAARCREIMETRAYTAEGLRALGFTALPSATNFILASCGWIPAAELTQALRERGVLVRHFHDERIENFIRVTIGAREQMAAFLAAVAAIRQEKGCA